MGCADLPEAAVAPDGPTGTGFTREGLHRESSRTERPSEAWGRPARPDLGSGAGEGNGLSEHQPAETQSHRSRCDMRSTHGPSAVWSRIGYAAGLVVYEMVLDGERIWFAGDLLETTHAHRWVNLPWTGAPDFERSR